MLYDLGVDPYADLKELQGTMQEVNELMRTLPNSPQSLQVKDTLSAMLANKAGQALLKRLPQTGPSSDPGVDRMQSMMDRYMPMIIAMNAIAKMSNFGSEPQQPQQQQRPEKAELPEEVKAELESMRAQLEETQSLLRQQTEDRDRKEFADGIIGRVTPQIEALQTQVENLTAALQAKANEPPPQPQGPTQEMLNISKQIDDLKDRLAEKEKSGLNLNDLETVMTTIESLEKRVRKDVPAGEFDWKSTTISTLGEIGREAVDVFKEISLSKNQQMPGQFQQSTSAPDMRQIAKQKVQNYIFQNLQKGIKTLQMDEAQRILGLTQEQIFYAYNELKAEGWITDKGQSGQSPPAANPQPPQPPFPQPASQQPQTTQPTEQSQPPGGQPNGRFDANSPFLER